MPPKSNRPRDVLVILDHLPPADLRKLRALLPANFPGALLDRLLGAVREEGTLEATPEELLAGFEIPASQFNKLLSQLHVQVDQYLVARFHDQYPEQGQGALMDAYQELGLPDRVVERRYRRLRKKLEGTLQSPDWVDAALGLEKAMLPYRVRHPKFQIASAFGEVGARLDEAFLVSKLRFASASVNEARIRNLAFPAQLVTQTQQLRDLLGPCQTVIGQAYEYVFQLSSEPIPPFELFQSSIQFIQRQKEQITAQEQFDLLHFIQNLCLREVDRGHRPFVRLAADLYRYLLEEGVLTGSGTLHPRIFKNILSLHARMGEFGYCAEFVEQHGNKLPPEERSFILRYGAALIQFYQKDHLHSAAGFRSLIAETPKDLYWGFECRNLLMKSLFLRFESLSFEELDELQRLLDSFRMFVRRNATLSDSRKKSYDNFYGYFRQLVRMKEEQIEDPEKLEEMKEALEQEEFITHKNWLRGVLEEF